MEVASTQVCSGSRPPWRGNRVQPATPVRDRPLEVVMAGKSSSGGSRARSASTGRFVSKATAARHPRTTVVESTSGSGSNGLSARSAITGRYVSQATARRHPDTTVTEG